MRLFLASYNFGDFGGRLQELVGDNRKSLVVSNALDYKDDKELNDQKELFRKNGIKYRELDLRKYFNKSEQLERYIEEYKPGLVVLLGGNTFLLRRALAQSGLDEILQKDIRNNKYVLAGYSAGAIVVGPSLRGYERLDKEKLVMPGYQKAIIWSGLKLTDIRIVPHADSPKYSKGVVALRQNLFDKNGWESVTLNDNDAFVVDGARKDILRGRSTK
jgi:dipeptidase E